MPKPSFDSWTSIFLFFAIQGILTGTVFLFIKRGQHRAFRYIGVLLLLFGLCLADYVQYWTGYCFEFPALAGFSFPLIFIFGPLLYFYFRSCLLGVSFRTKDLLHLLPWLLHTGWNLPYYFLSHDEKISKLLGHREAFSELQIQITKLIPWLQIVQMIVYAIVIAWLLRNTPPLKTMRRWSYGMLSWFAGFILAFISYFILIRFSFFSPQWDYMISGAMTLFITGVAVYGYLQPAIFEGYSVMEAPAYVPGTAERYRNSGLTETAARELADKLDKLMNEEQLYRNNELRLGILAEKLGTNKHHLSQVINDNMGFHFFEYINMLRIREAEQLLRDEQHADMTISEIAWKVGFNNRVSFNTAFKKHTGHTPTAFRKHGKV